VQELIRSSAASAICVVKRVIRGHKKADCWEDPKNSAKRPKNRKSKTNAAAETGQAQVDKNNTEVLLYNIDCEYCTDIETVDEDDDFMGLPGELALSALSVPNKLELLLDPDIWIADTGASVHSTPHEIGLNEKVGEAGSSIIVGSGESLAAVKAGSIRGLVCDQEGNELFPAKLVGVMVTKGAAYNLLSLTQFTEKGWLMSGNSESIVVSKEDVYLKFDIKINTSRGAIFAIYFKRIVVDTGLGSIAVQKWNIDVLHRRYGHSSEDATRATAKLLGYEVARGSMKYEAVFGLYDQ
jgi:hypothetical protein